MSATLGPNTCAIGKTISFEFPFGTSSETQQFATTNGQGVASVTYFAPNAGGTFTVQAAFNGAGQCGPSSATTQVFVFGPTPTPTPGSSSPTPTPTPAFTTTLKVGNVSTVAGQPFFASARLSSSNAGCEFPRTITFTFMGTSENVTTGLGGDATGPFTAGGGGVFPITASFAGTALCAPSSGSGQVTVVGAPATPTSTGTPTPGGPPGQPPVVITPSGLSFGSQAISSTSAPLTINLTNNQNHPMNVSSITITATKSAPGATGRADFSQTNSCMPSVPAAGSCSISVTFAPAASGLQTATLQVHDDLNATPIGAQKHPQKVSLVGTGVVPVTASASRVVYAATKVGHTSRKHTIRVKNHLKTALQLTVTPPGTDFVIVDDTCSGSVAARSSCHIDVAFQPSAAGTIRDSLAISNNASPKTMTIRLIGKGKR